MKALVASSLKCCVLHLAVFISSNYSSVFLSCRTIILMTREQSVAQRGFIYPASRHPEMRVVLDPECKH